MSFTGNLTTLWSLLVEAKYLYRVTKPLVRLSVTPMSRNDGRIESESDSEARALVEIPVVSHILTPGSSLHPTFLLVVDGVFIFLLLVLVSLLFITGGNLHFFALICITLALWASVKWSVRVLVIS